MFLIHFLHALVLFHVSGDSMLLMIAWKCFGCCCEWVYGWTCVEQWGRTDILAQASSSRLGENSSLLECSPRRGAVFLSDELSRSGETASPKWELAKSCRDTVAVSPKRESTAWARALLSPERRLPAWARPSSGSCSFPYMNVVGCLIGWFAWF